MMHIRRDKAKDVSKFIPASETIMETSGLPHLPFCVNWDRAFSPVKCTVSAGAAQRKE